MDIIKKAEMTWMTQRNSSGDPPISNMTARSQWEVDWMSYNNIYYLHKEGRNDMDDQTYLLRDPPMPHRNGIEDHGSTKLALSKFANAHSMAFLGMVLLL